MTRWRPVWRAIRFSIDQAGHVGGRDLDDAGDDLIGALRSVSDHPDQYRYRFDIDASHPNPWYHAMVFEIEGISDAHYARFVEETAALGLIEAPGRD